MSLIDKREQKRMEREAKISAREEKRVIREMKIAAREEKKRIAKMPAVKLSGATISSIISRLDPSGKFSETKVASLTARAKQLAGLRPQQILNRLKARQFQVAMIEAIFEEVKNAPAPRTTKEAVKKGATKKKK